MRVLVMRNAKNPEAIDASLLLGAYLSSQDIEFDIMDALKADQLPKQNTYDMGVALGGDGTILRMARYAGFSRMPILGINYGHLGFLANETDQGVVAPVTAALAGEVAIEERTNLRVLVQCWEDSDEQFEELCRASEETPLSTGLPSDRCFFALNEAAVTRGTLGWMIDAKVEISGSSQGRVRGDGLVVATATGSTAYALSAGGPLVAPGFRGLIAVPVAPHTLTARAMITDPHDVVEITLDDVRGNREAQLFIDGLGIKLDSTLRRVRVQRGSEPTILLRSQAGNFYDRLYATFFSRSAELR